MDLCGEYITHKVFGRGRIIGLENGCVTVQFIDSEEKKKFIYPGAFGRFLVLENEQLVKLLQDLKDEMAQSITAAQKTSEEIRAFELKQKAAKTKKAKHPSPKKKTVKQTVE